MSSDNELNFKHGLSLLDELECIRVKDKAKMEAMVLEFTKRGIATLADGRKIADIVIHGTQKHKASSP